MIEFITRTFALLATLIFFAVAGLSAGNYDIMLCSTCCMAGSIFFEITRGKKISWIHRSIVYGHALSMILINFISSNFCMIDMLLFLAIVSLWKYDFKAMKARCKLSSS